MGLSIRADPPPVMRRQHSDRQEKPKDVEHPTDRALEKARHVEKQPSLEKLEKPTRPSLTVPSPVASSQGSPADRAASPDKVYSSPLLPSPLVIQETKLRPQSRMVFPSEVSSWLSLADSPQSKTRELKQPTPPSLLSTAIASSPKPIDPTPHDVITAMSSSHALSLSTQVVPEEEPQPPPEREIPPRLSSMQSPQIQQTPTSPVASTHESVVSTLVEDSPAPQPTFQMPQPRPLTPPQDSHTARPSVDIETPRGSMDVKPPEPPARPAPQVPPTFQGLPRVSPSLLPHARISIPTSTVYPNASGRDVLCFIISIVIRPPSSQPITWNVSKLFSAFIDLDTKIRAKCGKGRKEWKSMVAPLPDSKAWKDFAPSKIDQRKAALEAYLQSLLVAPIADKSDLCDFLCTDPVQSRASAVRKEGYLTKKGKNFGGWKTRYFVLAGPVMEYYDSVSNNVTCQYLLTLAQAWWTSSRLHCHHKRSDWTPEPTKRIHRRPGL